MRTEEYVIHSSAFQVFLLMATVMDNYELHTPQHWNQDKTKTLLIEMKNKEPMYNIHEELNFKSLTYCLCSPGSVNIAFFVDWVSLNLVSDQIKY